MHAANKRYENFRESSCTFSASVPEAKIFITDDHDVRQVQRERKQQTQYSREYRRSRVAYPVSGIPLSLSRAHTNYFQFRMPCFPRPLFRHFGIRRLLTRSADTLNYIYEPGSCCFVPRLCVPRGPATAQRLIRSAGSYFVINN